MTTGKFDRNIGNYNVIEVVSYGPEEILYLVENKPGSRFYAKRATNLYRGDSRRMILFRKEYNIAKDFGSSLYLPDPIDLLELEREYVQIFGNVEGIPLKQFIEAMNSDQLELGIDGRLLVAQKIVWAAQKITSYQSESSAVGSPIYLDFRPSSILITNKPEACFLLFTLSKPPVLHTLISVDADKDYFAFAAPEQVVEGSTTDGNSMLFGLGMLLFHLITGKSIFHNSATTSRYMMRRRKARSLYPLISDVCPELGALDQHINDLLSNSSSKRAEAFCNLHTRIDAVLGSGSRTRIEFAVADCVKLLLKQQSLHQPQVLISPEADLITNIYE